MINMVGSALRQIVVLVPMMVVFLHLFGLGGSWFGFWSAEGMALCYSLLAVRRLMKQRL